MITTTERATMLEIKSRVLAKKPVADWEKQLVLDLLRREDCSVRADVMQRARNSGFNTDGIKTF
jgi:hypothetical protein